MSMINAEAGISKVFPPIFEISLIKQNVIKKEKNACIEI